MNTYSGPCLKHCYAKNNMLLLFCGVIVGYVVTKYLEKNNKK